MLLQNENILLRTISLLLCTKYFDSDQVFFLINCQLKLSKNLNYVPCYVEQPAYFLKLFMYKSLLDQRLFSMPVKCKNWLFQLTKLTYMSIFENQSPVKM